MSPPSPFTVLQACVLACAGAQWLAGSVPLARLILPLSELTLIFVSDALLLSLDAHPAIELHCGGHGLPTEPLA